MKILLNICKYMIASSVITGCAKDIDNYVNQNPVYNMVIDRCERSKIEEIIVRSYANDQNVSKNLYNLIDIEAFNSICAGNVKVYSPMPGIFTRHKFPEIRNVDIVEYNISKSSGICIVRKSIPISAGIFNEGCVK